MQPIRNNGAFCGNVSRASSRRDFLERAGLGFGSLAANYLLNRDLASAASPTTAGYVNPLAAKKPDFPAKAKSVIFLFMHGGPSHLDSFDPKPLLAELDGKPVPPSFGKVDFQFTKMEKVPLMASQRTFRKRGQSGIEISDLFENIAQHAD
ncbi:MAG TPA: DUF1501 domain-containing protein, partial [Sphingomonadaceae bacterium]|nr:DUF1501 domain-containing protein [Sphingomonadaceae bacterium]